MTVRHRQLQAHSIYLCHYLPSLTYRCRVPPLRAISATILVATGQSRTGEPAWQVDIYSCVTSPGLVKYRTETFCFKWRVKFNNKSFFFNCYTLKLRDTHRTSLKCYADFFSPFGLIFYFVSGNLEFLCIFIYIYTSLLTKMVASKEKKKKKYIHTKIYMLSTPCFRKKHPLILLAIS